MSEITASQILEVINRYDAISREELAYNLRKAMGMPTTAFKEQDYWLANLCGTTRNTTYSWFAPHRNSKAPLKVVAQIAETLSIPFMRLLEPPDKEANTELRKKSKRNTSFENDIMIYSKKYPDKSIAEIALDLGISDETVRRHLKNYKKAGK